MKSKVIVNSRKFDDSIHRRWSCELLEETLECWILSGIFNEEVVHNKLGVIKVGTVSQEYYFKNKWFNVFKFNEPTGEFRNFYCNVSLPPKFENNVLDYIDLDVDILVNDDFSYQVLDIDEFEENTVKYLYSNELTKKVFATLDELFKLIQLRAFPFNTATLRNIKRVEEK